MANRYRPTFPLLHWFHSCLGKLACLNGSDIPASLAAAFAEIIAISAASA
jgi:hypothetical protein